MNSWNVKEGIAAWANDSVALSFDQSKLESGIELRHSSTQATLNLFGLVRSEGLAHVAAFSSGATLRAIIQSGARFPVETEITWTVFEPEVDVVGLDTVITVTTQELEAHPLVELCSIMGIAEEATLEDPNCNELAARSGFYTLFHLPSADLSYLEMLLPASFHDCQTVEDSNTGHMTHLSRLFSCPLEKGVVLRAKLRGLLMSREGADAAAAARFGEFLSEPPPLSR